MSQPSVYKQLLNHTRYHFGSDAPGHISKMIEIHLARSPEEITREELISLMEWVKSTVSFLEDDKIKVEKYMSELNKLTGGEPEVG